MAFLGNSSSSANYVPQTDFFSGDGSTVAFTLSRAVVSAYQVEAVVANVIQNPSDAYTINGNVITFTSAPPAGTNNVYVRYAALNTTLLQPGQGTVLADQIATGAVVASKLGTGAAVANIGSRAIAGSQLPAGTVLQVVQATYSTQVANTTTTPASSGLTASITPTSASSKILVIISDPMRRGNGGVYGINLLLYRNGSNIFNPMTNMFYSNTGSTDLSNMVTLTYLDSPASSSSVTYTMYFASSGGGYPVYSQIDNNTGSIILMEIAA